MTQATQSHGHWLTSKLLGAAKTSPKKRPNRACEPTLEQKRSEASKIRLKVAPLRAPDGESELFVAGLLSSKNDSSYAEVINALADFIYHRELNKGAWLLDIGFLGKSLFVAEARRELESGKGIFWEIDPARKDSDELLSHLSRHDETPLPGDRWRSGGGAQNRGAAESRGGGYRA